MAHNGVHASSAVGAIRLRELPPDVNAKPDLSYKQNTIEFDPGDQRAAAWAASITQATKITFDKRTALVPVPGYISLYLCNGVELPETNRRLFVQIAAKQQEFVARRLVSKIKLSDKSIAVADDIEVVERSPTVSSVRYYSPQDAEIARSIASLVTDEIGYKAIPQMRDADKLASTGLIELWIGREVDGHQLQANLYRCDRIIDCRIMVAQSQPPAIDLATIGKICSGQTSATVPGGHGSYSDASGYTFQFDNENSLEVTRSGTLLYKIDKLTLDDVASCVAKIAGTLAQKAIPEQKECRSRNNGIERYQIDTMVNGNSPEMSGGHSQGEWCDTLIGQLKGQHVDAELTVVGSSRSSRSGCSPFNCPLYTYRCTVHLKADPIYILRKSPDCQ